MQDDNDSALLAIVQAIGNRLLKPAEILAILRERGWALVQLTPSPGLLASMAMRWSHDFGIDSHEVFGFQAGWTPAERASLVRSMAQLHEEVVGLGFYSPKREAQYAEMLARPAVAPDSESAANCPLTPAQERL